jgi:hypothetical protein
MLYWRVAQKIQRRATPEEVRLTGNAAAPIGYRHMAGG